MYRVAERRARARVCVVYIIQCACTFARRYVVHRDGNNGAVSAYILHHHCHHQQQHHHHRRQLSRRYMCGRVCECECVCVRAQYYLVISRRTNGTCRARTVTEYDDDGDARATGRHDSASTAFHSVLRTRVRSPVRRNSSCAGA